MRSSLASDDRDDNLCRPDVGNRFATAVAVQLRRESNGTGAGFVVDCKLGSCPALFGMGVPVVGVFLSAMNPPSTFIKLAYEPYTILTIKAFKVPNSGLGGEINVR